MAIDRNAARRVDNQDPAVFGQTPWQTVGPFFHYGLPWKGGADLAGSSEMGARPDLFGEAHYVLNLPAATGVPDGDTITIVGRVLAADGTAVTDAMVEVWQADAAGRYPGPDPRDGAPVDPHFIGFGRAAIDPDGYFRFRTIRPGRVPGPGNSLQAPHIAVAVFGRGILKRLATRLYFADGAGNADDPILTLVPPERRGTLIARDAGDATWRFDIRLGGKDETVFFAL